VDAVNARAIALVARLVAVLIPLAIVQIAVVSQIRLFGAAPDLLLALALSVGVVGGPDRGARVGFAAGLAYDVFLTTPLGLSALVYTLAAYSVGLFQLPLTTHPRWWKVGSVAIATVAAVLLWSAAGLMIGQDQLLGMALGRIALVEGLANATIALPMLRIAAWLYTPRIPERAIV